ncbi:MAG: zinc-ribbon domain-containing protein [Deltaproteobacteria bacterium]|nr:zinc-ribbon domain-containing protein [Deltaproteobacteria bacterium]
MSSITGPASVNVSAAELSWLLARHRVNPAACDLFQAAARVAADDGAEERLRDAGFLNQDLGAALRAAVQTGFTLQARYADLDALGRGLYFAGEGGAAGTGGLLVWQRPGGDYRLTYPADQVELLRQTTGLLSPVEAAPPPLFEGIFTGPALTALATVIDYLRTLYAASLLERRGLPGLLIRREDLAAQLSAAKENRDYRSLVALWQALAPSLISADPAGLAAGIADLSQVGLLLPVEQGQGGWSPAGELVGMAQNLLVPLGSLWLAGGGTDSAAPRQLIAVRGNSLWLGELRGEAAESTAGVRLRAVDGLVLLTEIQGFFAAAILAAGQPKPEAAVSAPAAEPGKAASREPGAAAPKRFCTACGAKLKPGRNFCTNCGAKL